MARRTLTLDGLFRPFKRLQEIYSVIPPGQSLFFKNPGFKVVLFLGGGLEMELPDGTTVKVEEGDAFSLSMPVRQVYRGLNPRREASVHALRLDFDWPMSWQKEAKSRPAGSLPETRFQRAMHSGLCGFRYFPRTIYPEHHRLIRQLLGEMDQPDAASAWRASALCQLLIAGLLRTEGIASRRHAPVLFRKRGPATVENVRQYLEQNCHEALTLSVIAWKVQLSGEHLARIFKQQTGKTVFGHLDEIRVEKARRLLLTTELPLAQVARSCGYSSSSLLSRHFKKQTGMPPLGFRLRGRTQELFWPSTLSPLAPGEAQRSSGRDSILPEADKPRTTLKPRARGRR